MNIASQVAQHLLQINAIKLSPQNPFTWASGLRSPIYCDNRIVLSYPLIRNFIIDCFVDAAGRLGAFDTIAGVATAGIAPGVLLAARLQLPFIYVRSTSKAHGRQNTIEGEVKGGERVLVIEDLISTGGSSLQAVQSLREAGCEVVGVLAIFTYGFEQADAAFRKAGCPFATLSNYHTLIEEAVRQNRINSSQLDTLHDWRRDPTAWSENFSRLNFPP